MGRTHCRCPAGGTVCFPPHVQTSLQERRGRDIVDGLEIILRVVSGKDEGVLQLVTNLQLALMICMNPELIYIHSFCVCASSGWNSNPSSTRERATSLPHSPSRQSSMRRHQKKPHEQPPLILNPS